MKRDITKAVGDTIEDELFDNWFAPIETNLRTQVRGFIETMIEEELAQALSWPRYGRRLGPTAQDGAMTPAIGYRHGHRTRALTGTFGRTDTSGIRE
jgi:hypothetical protein